LTGLILAADAAVLEDASEDDVSVMRVLVPANAIAFIHTNI